MSAFSKFKQKAAASDSIYLRAADIEEGKTIKGRVIPWLLKNKITPIHFYYEGWVEGDKKGDKAKSVRFAFNDEGGPDCDLDEYKWAEGDYGFQTPVGAFVFVFLNETDEKIQVFSGTQKTILGPLSDYFDPDSDRHIKDWTAYQFLFTKKNKKFTIEREKLDKEDRGYPKWFDVATRDFHFTLDDYLKGRKTPEGEGHTYRDVLDMLGDKPQEQEVTESEFTAQEMASWGDVTTPKGSRLSVFPYEKLVDMRQQLDAKNFDKKNKLYRAILCGIKANEPPPFETEETTDEVGF
jgi:hypothetical protein